MRNENYAETYSTSDNKEVDIDQIYNRVYYTTLDLPHIADPISFLKELKELKLEQTKEQTDMKLTENSPWNKYSLWDAEIRPTGILMPASLKNTTTPPEMIKLIERVVYNEPVTIVFWKNGDKTVVKTYKEDFDPEKGLAMAICKYLMGNTREYYDVFKVYDEHREDRKKESQLKQLQHERDKINKEIKRLGGSVETEYKVRIKAELDTSAVGEALKNMSHNIKLKQEDNK